MRVYDERLTVPWWWWGIAVFLLWTLWLVYATALDNRWAIPLTAVAAAGVAAGFARYGAARITVTDGILYAGRARIPLSALGRVEPLDAEAARLLRGPHADARAYLVLRAYIPTAVRVEIVDPHDSTPYAYLSSRKPRELAAALVAACSANSGP